jgi:histidine ammonia-lyase
MSNRDTTQKFSLVLDGQNLTIEQLVKVARSPFVEISLSPDAVKRMNSSRNWIESVQKNGEPVVYGINTGFGSQAIVSIDKEKLHTLQQNLIMSHSAGTGDPLPLDVARATMLLRANTLARGYSGIRVSVAETLLKMIEKNVIPWMPSQGSLGASGDLAPLSHLALVVCELGRVPNQDYTGRAYYLDPKTKRWELMSGRAAMKRAGIPQIKLEAKEGLALNNGTQVSTAILALAYYDAVQIAKCADIAMSMTLEALQGLSAAFRPEIHELRPHPGQIATAENIRKLVAGSQLLDRQIEQVQDAYSLRCHPQVMAGVRDTFRFIENILRVEMNATNDNPIILPELKEYSKAISGGNFHGQSVAFAADFLSIVLCEIGNISERRIFRLSDKNLNRGLPSFLISNPGLENGLMIAQYTAASLVSENKSLAHPASIDSIPSCENQEDHVSMSPISARKARQILSNIQKIVAIELIYAAQALELILNRERQKIDTTPQKLFGKGTYAAFLTLRKYVSFLEKDRPIYLDIEKTVKLIQSGDLIDAVEKVTGDLNP